jgi:hypothetical protein
LKKRYNFVLQKRNKMEVKITLINDRGEEIAFSRKLGALDTHNIISSVEQELLKLQGEIGPFLSETIIEEHQRGFVGEKNQEEKRA